MVGFMSKPTENNNTIKKTYSDLFNCSSEDLAPLLMPDISLCKMSETDEFPEHCHRHKDDRQTRKVAQRQLTIACVLCFLFVLGEILGGYYSGSLAIMADAAHMFSDFASFGVSLFVIWLGEKKPRKSMTFGFQRAEALGALATVVIIWYVTGILTYLAIERLQSGVYEIHDDAMLAVASAAVLFNITLGLCLHGVCCTNVGNLHGHSHGGHDRLHEEGDVEVQGNQEKHINIRAALIHVLGDFLQSLGVLFSSVLIKIFGESCKVVDPICTLVFAGIVLVTTVSVLRDTLRILVEGTPKNINYDLIREDLLKISDVCGVHDLHIWSLTADLPALSVHLLVSPDTQVQKVLMEADRVLKDKHKVLKTTIQVEMFPTQASVGCVSCQPLES